MVDPRWHECNDLCQGDVHFKTAYLTEENFGQEDIANYLSLGYKVVKFERVECSLPGDNQRLFYRTLRGTILDAGIGFSSHNQIIYGVWFKEKEGGLSYEDTFK